MRIEDRVGVIEIINRVVRCCDVLGGVRVRKGGGMGEGRALRVCFAGRPTARFGGDMEGDASSFLLQWR